MNDLTSRALELQHAAHELMYLGMDGEPVYSDTFCRLNKEVLVKSDSLFSAQSSDVEEEANLCLALLMGYNAGKSSVSCPLKPSDSAPLKHSTMPP